MNYTNGVASELYNFVYSNYSFLTGDTSAPVLLFTLERYRATTFCDTSAPETPDHQWSPALMMKMEVYAGFAVGYKPLKRVAFEHLLDNMTIKTIEEQTPVVFSKAIEQIGAAISNPVPAIGLISTTQMDAYNAKDFNYPVLQTGELKKGVYLTLEEFQKNEPAYREFTVQNGTLGDMITIVDADGKEYPVRNVWGYCDGKNAYLKMADNYYTLYPAQNAFNLMGAKEVTSRKRTKIEAYLLFGLNVPSSKDNQKTVFRLVLKPLQLEVATGEVW